MACESMARVRVGDVLRLKNLLEQGRKIEPNMSIYQYFGDDESETTEDLSTYSSDLLSAAEVSEAAAETLETSLSNETAASVIYIISSGFQACQELLRYYQPFKESDEDIKPMYTSLDILGHTLAAVERIIKQGGENKTFGHDAALIVKGCVESFRDQTDKLHEELALVSAVTKPNSVRVLRHWQYPFKQTTLIKIENISEKARHSLQPALEFWHMYVEPSSDLLRSTYDVSLLTELDR